MTLRRGFVVKPGMKVLLVEDGDNGRFCQRGDGDRQRGRW